MPPCIIAIVSCTNGDFSVARCYLPAMKNPQFTRAQKNLMRAYALHRERTNEVVRVRFLPSGDVRAYCADGYSYLIAPTAELLKEARSASQKG